MGSRLFGKRGCDPGMLPGGWFGIRREGLGPPGYRGDMNGCGKENENVTAASDQPNNMIKVRVWGLELLRVTARRHIRRFCSMKAAKVRVHRVLAVHMSQRAVLATGLKPFTGLVSNLPILFLLICVFC